MGILWDHESNFPAAFLWFPLASPAPFRVSPRNCDDTRDPHLRQFHRDFFVESTSLEEKDHSKNGKHMMMMMMMMMMVMMMMMMIDDDVNSTI